MVSRLPGFQDAHRVQVLLLAPRARSGEECGYWTLAQNFVYRNRSVKPGVGLHTGHFQTSPLRRRDLPHCPFSTGHRRFPWEKPTGICAHGQGAHFEFHPSTCTGPSPKRNLGPDGSCRVFDGCRGRLSLLCERRGVGSDADAHFTAKRRLSRQRRARGAGSRLRRSKGEWKLSGQSATARVADDPGCCAALRCGERIAAGCDGFH